ncbi:hypothetical protein OD350_03805 [Clostridium beijerinckii]|uniref:hypothetical protein n=1 Tax=Clostridium beijerinckii TaxID=1520 RepID=UPI002227D0C5|nr:hypothetical protein [Clostridium beijerinckii]UYZ36807.1 hypothetical protein OD350_03805 [Clostridium beijerinckii]
MPVLIQDKTIADKFIGEDNNDSRHMYYSDDYNLIEDYKDKLKINPAETVKYKWLTDYIYMQKIGMVSWLDIMIFCVMFTILGMAIPTSIFIYIVRKKLKLK